jgi:exportin-2 (importin alpha re-exporter)
MVGKQDALSLRHSFLPPTKSFNVRMADLSALFLASLNPQTRKQAESTLAQYATQPEFVLHLLQLTLDGSQDRAVRLAASVYLKNIARKRWTPVSYG